MNVLRKVCCLWKWYRKELRNNLGRKMALLIQCCLCSIMALQGHSLLLDNWTSSISILRSFSVPKNHILTVKQRLILNQAHLLQPLFRQSWCFSKSFIRIRTVEFNLRFIPLLWWQILQNKTQTSYNVSKWLWLFLHFLQQNLITFIGSAFGMRHLLVN